MSSNTLNLFIKIYYNTTSEVYSSYLGAADKVICQVVPPAAPPAPAVIILPVHSYNTSDSSSTVSPIFPAPCIASTAHIHPVLPLSSCTFGSSHVGSLRAPIAPYTPSRSWWRRHCLIYGHLLAMWINLFIYCHVPARQGLQQTARAATRHGAKRNEPHIWFAFFTKTGWALYSYIAI